MSLDIVGASPASCRGLHALDRHGVCLLCVIVGTVGCSLDLARLQTDDSGTARDGSAASDGGADAGPRDAQIDGSAAPDGGTLPPVYLERIEFTDLEAPVESISAIASTAAGGSGWIGVSQRTVNSLEFFELHGDGCDIRITNRIPLTMAAAGPVVMTDLNANGSIDILYGYEDAKVAILAGEGTTTEISHLFGQLSAIAVGPGDGDTLEDIALYQAGASAQIYLLQPNFSVVGAGGGFTGSGFTYLDGLFVDIDGTHGADRVGLHAFSSTTTFSISRNLGSATFAGPDSRAVPSSAARMATGPVGPGGGIAAVIVGGTEISIVSVTDVAIDLVTFNTSYRDLRDVVVTELDGSSPPEIVVSDGTGLHVLRHVNAALTMVFDVPTAGAATELAAFDADSDGRNEIAVVEGTSIGVYSPACE